MHQICFQCYLQEYSLGQYNVNMEWCKVTHSVENKFSFFLNDSTCLILKCSIHQFCLTFYVLNGQLIVRAI